jgi:hypothetical protein
MTQVVEEAVEVLTEVKEDMQEGINQDLRIGMEIRIIKFKKSNKNNLQRKNQKIKKKKLKNSE